MIRKEAYFCEMAFFLLQAGEMPKTRITSGFLSMWKMLKR
jgi:hypothetical protein